LLCFGATTRVADAAPDPLRRNLKKSIETACELCGAPGGDLLWEDGFCRIVLVDDPDYAGFCRVILGSHVKEMTDLAPAERKRFMDAVFAAESALRELLQPDKVNLASLGNATPHLHWHVIPRYRGDRHFPRPVWAEPARNDAARRAPPDRAALARLLRAHLE
jgi:diadenosine tetraphosphate (Ap4A) HIT family hydrolase